MNNLTKGNNTPNFEPNVVPIFEPNQVLKNTDLNSIVTYLDSHNRLTRTHLIGIGIVCGLEVQASVTLDEISISAGCGITSEGFFVQYLPPSGVSDQNRFTHYRSQQLNKNRLISSESKDEQYQLKELITVAVATANPNTQEIKPLTNLDNLAQQVVLILCDWDDQPRDSCLVDCDDRGRDRNFHLRFFLIDKSAAEELIRSGFALRPEESLSSALQGWFEVPDCHINRLVSPSQSDPQVVDLAQITDFDTLMTAYYSVCKAAILSIDTALQQTQKLFSPFISTFHPTSNAFTDLRNRLRDILIGLVPLAISNADRFPYDANLYVSTQTQVGYGIQYFYDYLVELVTAFNELKEALFDLMDECPPNMQWFPKYLLAGLLVPPIVPCDPPDIYRHSFYQPPIYNGNQQRKREVRHLYERLVQMSTKFTLLPFYQTPVKITPSRNRQALLGEQAIPYYYSYLDLYPYWNYDACRKQRASQLPAYFRLNGLNALSNQRGYDLIPRIDWADFFRVEGHLGLPLTEAIAQIESYKDDFNLAFDLVVVRVGEGIDDPDLLQGYFDDLEIEFDQIKADWQQKYANAEETLKVKYNNIWNVLENFNEYFFKHPDLTKIDLSLMKNDFLEKAKDPSNYEFRPINGGTNAVQLMLNITKTRPFRIGLATNFGGDPQISRIHRFTFTNTTDLEKDKKQIKEIFAADFAEKSGDLQVEIDDRELFRFVISYGQEDIELSGDDLKGLWIRVEDETPYISAEALIDRYHDFDALFTFLQYFGNRDQVVTSGEAARLVSYYEFRALFHRYLLRLESVKEMQLFQKYAKQHRGLEHLGGVPKGGTLVLVYTSKPEVINSFIASDSALASLSNGKVAKIKAKAQFPSAVGEDRGKAISLDRINKNVVIADFSLPYLCCSAYSSLNYVVSQPKPFISLPKPVYCEDDEKIYDFILDPPGGLLKGGDGIVDHNGNYAFQPSTVDADVTEPMNLTFFYIVDGVGSSYSILLLPHAEIQFSIFPNDSPACIHPDPETSKLIRLNALPDGGKFRMAINGNPDQEITVTKDNDFDLKTITFPPDQNVLRLTFRYILPNTDDYCGGRSEPQELILLRQPKATIAYDRDKETGEAIGKLVYDSENCKNLSWQVEFRNIGSEADTYEWRLNGEVVADTRNVTLNIPYKPDGQTTVRLIARNRYEETEKICTDIAEINVKLPPLDPSWTFDNKDLPTQPENPKIIVLCRNGSNEINQEPLTVEQSGGTFTINPKGLLIALKNSKLPCEQQKEYILSFAKSGTYTITYTLPDGKNFSRQVEVAIVPVGNFNLDVGFAQEQEFEGFKVNFTDIQPTQEELSHLEYHWEITIGKNPAILTKETTNFFVYNDDLKIRPGEPISVVMKLSNLNGICATVSEPKTSQVPMEVTKLELYQAFSNEGGQIEWENIGEIEDGSLFAISGLGEVDLNIRAITTPSVVGNVLFVLNIPRGQQAPKTTPDELAPYDLYRNPDDDTQVTGWKPRRGAFMLTASPFQRVGGQPYQGNVKQVKFTLQPQSFE
jgi:hypothetical protein